MRENDLIKILHVDDNEDYLNLLELRLPLEDNSIFIEKAKSAKIALSMLSKKEFDCVLVDYEMSGMNGLEFLEAAKEKKMMVPFIFLTGQGNEEVAAQAFRLGADDYFTKDNTFAHFPRLVNSIKQNIAKYRHMKSEQYAAEALLKREKQLMALVSSLDELILLVDNKGVIIECFKPAKSFGTSNLPGDLLGMRLNDILPRELSPTIDEAMKQIRNNMEGKELEFAVDPDDDSRWHRIKILPFLGQTDITDYLVLIQDITDKMENRRSLIESEKRYRFLLENTFDYIYQIDIETGKYNFISPKISKLMGIPLEEIMDTPNFGRNMILEEDREQVILLDKMRQNEPEKENLISFRFYTANNEIKYIEQRSKVVLFDGKPRYIIGVFRDVTETVRSENFNKKLEAVYRDFFTESAEAVLLISDREGNVIDVVGDVSFKKKYGFPDLNFIGKNLRDFLEKQYLEANQGKISANFQKGLHVDDYFLLEHSKKKFYIYAKAVAIKDFNRDIERIIVLLQDVTDNWGQSQPPPEAKIFFK